jgi:ribulose-phosphate 3-epimerase
MSFLLSPSILSADYLHLGKEIEMLNQSEADWLHLDVMDGVFVPNISMGFPVLEQVSKISTKPLDVHLMVIEPQKFIPHLQQMGVDTLSVHYEICPHLQRVVTQIKSAGMKASVVLNPHTPVELLTDILDDLDMVLIMSVNPGFPAQKFIPHSVNKVSRLKEMIRKRELKTLIEVDGGINLETGRQILEAGADVLVIGNTLFGSPDPQAMIKRFKEELRSLDS